MGGEETLRRYLTLWLLGLYLRLTVMVVPPLSLLLERQLGFGTSELAVAVSLPSLLIGGGALVSAWLIGRFGVIATVAAGIAIMAAGSALRSLPLGISFFLLATVVMGFGIALMQIGMPVLARSWSPHKVGRASAVYANGLLVGELLAAALTGPVVVRLLGEHWLWTFTLWVLPMPFIVLLVLREHRTDCTPAVQPSAPEVARLSWRDPLLWRVALLLAAAGSLYYVGNIFLPQILSRTARLSLIDPGLTVLNGVQLLSSAVLMVYADRLLGSSWPLLLTLALGLLSIPALLWLPGLGVIAAAGLLGIAASALYVLAITLPAWLVPLEQVARMAAGVTVVANVLTFVLPAGAAWLSDATDSIALGFLPIAVIIVLSMLAPLGIKPRRADAAAT